MNNLQSKVVIVGAGAAGVGIAPALTDFNTPEELGQSGFSALLISPVPALSLTSHSAVLCGSEKQRVALAQAIVHRPKMLILHEPLASLDPRSQAALVERHPSRLLHQLAAQLLDHLPPLCCLRFCRNLRSLSPAYGTISSRPHNQNLKTQKPKTNI